MSSRPGSSRAVLKIVVLCALFQIMIIVIATLEGKNRLSIYRSVQQLEKKTTNKQQEQEPQMAAGQVQPAAPQIKAIQEVSNTKSFQNICLEK